MSDQTAARPLLDVNGAAKLLSVSRIWLYRLPSDTPGVYCFGRTKRFDPEALKSWARGKANSGASGGR